MDTKSGNEATDRYRWYYKRLFGGATALGFHPYLVDDPKNFEENLSTETRDETISKNIKALFDRHECGQAVMIIGKAHIAPDVPNRTTVVKRLRANFSVVTLNPIFANEVVPDSTYYSWNGLCERETLSPEQGIIFGNSGIADELLYPRYNLIGKFGDFDFTILFPSPTK